MDNRPNSCANLAEEIERIAKLDPGKLVFYVEAIRGLNYEGINYKQEGNRLIVEVMVNELTYKKVEIEKDKFSGFSSVKEVGYFLKDSTS